MTTLSIVLIVKDESENIVPCLESASFADEIVIVDAGSSDNTLDLIPTKYFLNLAGLDMEFSVSVLKVMQPASGF